MASPWQRAIRRITQLPSLQHRDFRLLWIAQLAATIGLQMQTIAVNWHVYTLLRDTASTITLFGRTFDLDAGALGLGGLGLVRWLPVVLFGIVGGILADTRNRRRLLIVTQLLAVGLAATLAILSFTGGISVLAIYLLVAGLTALTAIEIPAREALVPNLVPRRELTNAISLITMTMVIGTITGPALSGLLLETSAIGVIYALHALSYLPTAFVMIIMHYHGNVERSGNGINWRYIVDGFDFTFSTHMIRSTMLVDFFAVLLGSARTLLPIVADQVLGIGAGGYGLLATAQPLGSVIAASVASLRRDIRRQGAIFLICVAAYGLGTALFGVSTVFALSYLLFGITGAADTISSIIRSAIRQMWTPDRLRGRMVGVNMIFYNGGPQLGEVRAGMVAAAFGAPVAIITGGLAAALTALWAAWRDPRLRRYTSDEGHALIHADVDTETGKEPELA